MNPFRFEKLAKQSRNGFACGNAELDRYLIQQARQDQRRNYAVCYLAIEQQSNEVVGYYTLSSASISLRHIDETVAKKLPRYPVVPAVRIGRLAVSTSFQGRGLAGGMLGDAVVRIQESGIGAFAVLVDAVDDAAEAFYKHHGFVKVVTTQTDDRLLFLPIPKR